MTSICFVLQKTSGLLGGLSLYLPERKSPLFFPKQLETYVYCLVFFLCNVFRVKKKKHSPTVLLLPSSRSNVFHSIFYFPNTLLCRNLFNHDFNDLSQLEHFNSSFQSLTWPQVCKIKHLAMHSASVTICERVSRSQE